MPFTAEKQLKSFKDQGYSISHNPRDNRNCPFHALSYLLRKIDIHRSPRGVCQEVVTYVSKHQGNSEGQPLECFAGLPW